LWGPILSLAKTNKEYQRIQKPPYVTGLPGVGLDLRLNAFPRGLGKGHDAAVLGAWLAEEVQRMSIPTADFWLVYIYIVDGSCMFLFLLYSWGYAILCNIFEGKTLGIQEGRFKDILAVIKTSICANDRFWRAIYAHGIWIPRLVAEQIVKDGWQLTVTRHCFIFIGTNFQ